MSVIEVILSATAGAFLGYVFGNLLANWVCRKDDNDD